MERNDRLDFLKRKNTGRLLLPDLKAELAQIFALSPDNLTFLSLEKSDEIQQRAEMSFPPRQDAKRNIEKYPFFRKLMPNSQIAQPLLPDDAGDVFLSLDPECSTAGVLQLASARVNKGWLKLLDLRPDGFTLVDPQFLNQCVVDVNTDEVPGQSLIDIAMWGPRWSEFIRSNK